LISIQNEILNNQVLPLTEAVVEVKKSFKFQGGVGAAEEDDDVIASSTRISRKCPIGLLPIQIPARGK